jgi:DNA-binding XRE family transcriptional regulator
MSACPKCESTRLELGPQRAVRQLFGSTFRATVPGTRCLACEEIYYDGLGLLRFELAIAGHLAAQGPVSGESLSWMRRALGLTGEKLAELLHVRSETLSRWETGKREVDYNAWLTASSLVLDEIEGRGATREKLEAIARPRKSKQVTVDLSRIPTGLPTSLAGH